MKKKDENLPVPAQCLLWVMISIFSVGSVIAIADHFSTTSQIENIEDLAYHDRRRVDLVFDALYEDHFINGCRFVMRRPTTLEDQKDRAAIVRALTRQNMSCYRP